MAQIERETAASGSATLLSKGDRSEIKHCTRSVKAARVCAEVAHVLFSHLNEKQRAEYSCRSEIKHFAEGVVSRIKSMKCTRSVKEARACAEMAHVLFSHLNEKQRAEYACHLLVCGAGGKPSPLCALFPIKRPAKSAKP